MLVSTYSLAISCSLVAGLGALSATSQEPRPLTPADSLQAAIDAAPPGATLVLGEGVFDQRLVVAKPLTLQGAGWERTRIHPSAVDGTDPLAPTLLVRGAADVRLAGLRFGGPPREWPERAIASDALVTLQDARVAIESCAVVGPATHGIVIEAHSSLVLRDSLVAALWGTGVAVQGGEPPSELTIEGCVVRSCYHRGVTLGGVSGASTLRDNWISGSAWHGVRYDGGAPTIEGNVIYGNARSGIYASGKTSATVRGNLFARNEMGGMSCWSGNADTIESNLFVDNRREGIAVIGPSQPRLRANVFLGDALAISCAKSSGEGAVGAPVLEENRFLGPGPALRVGAEDRPLPGSNLAGEAAGARAGRFRGVEIALDAETLRAQLATSPWPTLLPEEAAMVPAGESRSFEAWERRGRSVAERAAAGDPRERESRQSAARKAAQQWIDDGLQLTDVARREAAVEALRAAIASDDTDEVRRGLTAFVALAQVRFDKTTQRDRFRTLLGSDDPTLRSLALSALRVAGIEAGDLDRFIALTRDPDEGVRAKAGGELVIAANRDLTGPAGVAIQALLDESEPRARRQLLAALWGSSYSPTLEARLIELSRGPEGDDVLYYALSTQANKSSATVARLVELLGDHDTVNVAGRAAWGLQSGVAPADAAAVAEASLSVLAAREQGPLFSKALDLLERYAGPAQAPALEAWLAKPGLDDALRARFEQVIAAARAR